MLLQPTIKATTRGRKIKLRPLACTNPNHWVWPLPAFANAQPGIVGHADDSLMAVDIGYPDPPSESVLVPVYAVHEGTIQLARETVSGFAIVVDHHGESSSYYGRLHRMICSPTWDDARPKLRVGAGQLIGYTTTDEPIRFELWRWVHDAGFVPTAPEPQMLTWAVLRERDPRPSGAPHNTNTNTHALANSAA